MFGLGMWEIVIVLGALLVVLGPTMLPRLGRDLGKSLLGLRNAAETFGDELQKEMTTPRPDPKELPPGAPTPGSKTDGAA